MPLLLRFNFFSSWTSSNSLGRSWLILLYDMSSLTMSGGMLLGTFFNSGKIECRLQFSDSYFILNLWSWTPAYGEKRRQKAMCPPGRRGPRNSLAVEVENEEVPTGHSWECWVIWGTKGLHLGGPKCPSGNTGPGSACGRQEQEDCCRFEAHIGHRGSFRPAKSYRVRPSQKWKESVLTSFWHLYTN